VTNVEKAPWRGVPIKIGSSYQVLLRAPFFVSLALLVLEIFAFILLTPKTGLSWLPNVAAIPVGVFLGAVVAPRPMPPNNQTHAEVAVSRLVETARSVGSAKSSLDELLVSDDPVKFRIGVERVSVALERDVLDLVGAASEWDKIDPGVTARTVSEIEKREALAVSFGIKE